MIHVRSVDVDAPDGTHILRAVELEIAAGSCVALVGRSGAGKSTCLRLVNGLVSATRGEVQVEGRPLSSHDLVTLRRRVGYVIQQVGLLPHLDVADNVALVPRLLGWPEARTQSRIDETLGLVGLDPNKFRTRRPKQLSGGEQQRVGIARALAAEPPIVLMDEPFGALDPLTRADLRRDVRALRRTLGFTMLVVTHDVREAIVLSDRVVLIDDGKVAVDAPSNDFLRSSHPIAAAYARSLMDTSS